MTATRQATSRRSRDGERGRTTGGRRAAGALAAAAGALALAGPAAAAQAGSAELWAPHELHFQGPSTNEEIADPNPFLDYRLQVLFTAPSGATYDVPGFYAGSEDGSGVGPVWTARVLPDELGTWSWTASFRAGEAVAIDLAPDAGAPTHFDGATGTVDVHPPVDPEGFHAKGRLEYVGEHHLRFQDGTWFLKTGTDSPENLLGYDGFDAVQDLGGLPSGVIHRYEPHVGDWQPGDPHEGAAGSAHGLKGLVGALNYLEAQGVNSVYFLPLNLGGDGQDTTPHLFYKETGYAKTHFDVSRLHQWNTVFEHAMRRGVQLQFVLSETEPENEDWLDDGQLGVERKLFFRELVARFAHHNAVKWNLGEEPDFSTWMLGLMADYIAAVDPYDHPLGVHTRADDFSDYEELLGDPRFTITSIQYSNDMAGAYVEEWREKSAAAGHPWVLDMDENGTPSEGLSDDNAAELRKTILYDVLFSGGGVEWYAGAQPLPLGGDPSLEDFRTREEMWRYSRYAREVLEDGFEFWRMAPADDLVDGAAGDLGGAEVFAHADGSAVVYLPSATATGALDLTAHDAAARFLLRWHDPRTGTDVGPNWTVPGGDWVTLGPPPELPAEDWVLTVRRLTLYADAVYVPVAAPVQTLHLDAGPEHAFHPYRVLSSASGAETGTPIGGVVLPLTWDLFTTISLDAPQAFGPGFVGVLDAQGRAQAQVDLTGKLGPQHVGLSLHHAFLAGPSQDGNPTFASNPVPFKVVP